MRALVLVVACAACSPPSRAIETRDVHASGVVGAGSIRPNATAGRRVCGNGKVEPSEMCDDGNTTSGDGCSSTCTVEIGYLCRAGGPSGTSSRSSCYPSGWLWAADADDAIFSDQGSVTSWDAIPSQFVPQVVDVAHEPILEAKALNGHNALAFDGVAKTLKFSGTASAGAAIADTLTFDLFLVARVDALQTFAYFFTNTNVSTERGTAFLFNATANPWIIMNKSSGVSHVNKQGSTTISLARWHVLEFRGDGANYTFAMDCGAAESNTAFSNTPATTGEYPRDFVFASNTPVDDTRVDIDLAWMRLWPRSLAAGERTNLCNTLTARYGSFPVSPPERAAFLGTSITFGAHPNTGFPTMVEVRANTNAPGTFAGANYGLNADTSTNMLARFNSTITGKGYTHLIVEGWCLNDLAVAADNAGAQSTAEAGCETRMNTLITNARADNEEIYLLTITPWATCTSSSTNRQNATITFDTFVRGLNGSQSGHVHLYDANADTNLGTGSPPQLKPANDSGDGCHPNQAGSDVIATGIMTAVGL